MKVKNGDDSKEITYAIVTQAVIDLNDAYNFYETVPSWAFKDFLKNNREHINSLLYFFDKNNIWGQTLLDACNMHDLPSSVEYKLKKINDFL